MVSPTSASGVVVRVTTTNEGHLSPGSSNIFYVNVTYASSDTPVPDGSQVNFTVQNLNAGRFNQSACYTRGGICIDNFTAGNTVGIYTVYVSAFGVTRTMLEDINTTPTYGTS